MLMSLVATALVLAPIGMGPLAEPERERLRVLVVEALNSGDATQEQYENVVLRLNSDPCKLASNNLTDDEKDRLEGALSLSMSISSVEVYSWMSLESWYVVHSNISPGDATFGFFSSNPMGGAKPIAFWAGAAAFYEVGEISEWVTEHVPGAPRELAECFAWSMTMGAE